MLFFKFVYILFVVFQNALTNSVATVQSAVGQTRSSKSTDLRRLGETFQYWFDH